MEHLLGEGEAWGQGPTEGLWGAKNGTRAVGTRQESSTVLYTSPCSQPVEEQRESIQGTEDEAVGEEVSSKASP